MPLYRRNGGTGRRSGLKIRRPQGHESSSLSSGTNSCPIPERDGVDFNLTFIPSSFNFPHKEEFDNEYMRKRYDVGYDQAVGGIPWAKTPPG